MIQVETYNKNDVKLVIKTKNAFREHLSLIKDLPVQSYHKAKKLQTMPLSDVPLLKKLCDSNLIKLSVSDDVKKQYKQHKAWRKKQKEIKESKSFDGWDILTKKLFDFQTVGAEFVYNAKNALLLDHVGLGKTIQSLAVMERHMIDDYCNFCIIICPSTLKRNWAEEIEKFTKKDYIVISGTKAKRKKLYQSAYKYDYMIINYDLLSWDLDFIDKFILKRNYNFGLIVDEVQYIKNHTAMRSKTTKQISNFSKAIIALSATVLENNVLDIWSIFQLIDEGVFGDTKSLFQFKRHFVITNFFDKVIGYKKPKLIKSKMAPYSIRRFKEDVLEDLPERIESNIWVELSKEQRKIYDEVSNNIVNSISDMQKAGRIEMATVLPMITYLRQCSLSSGLVGTEEHHSSKMDELLKFLESVDDSHKFVIFTHFIGMVEHIYDKLTENNYKCIAMHSDTGKRLGVKLDDRVGKINEFNESKDIRFLVTSDILNTGVNITSASYMINMDLLFNPAKMEQRIGRIDRIGNKNKVINIINILAENTIEDKVYEIVSNKRSASKDLIDDNKIEVRLTIQNLKNILDI